jgi:hypothetical protein
LGVNCLFLWIKGLLMSTPQTRHLDQLNSTALKWASDGELSALDLERIMARLAVVDPALQGLHESGRGRAPGSN